MQRQLLSDDLAALDRMREALSQVESDLESLLGELTEDEQMILLNDANDDFNEKKVGGETERILSSVENAETKVLNEYLTISRKNEKLAFTKAHPEIQWRDIEVDRNGLYSRKAIKNAIKAIQLKVEFPEDSFEKRTVTAFKLLESAKELKSNIRTAGIELENETIETIEHMTEEQIYALLEAKWITPLVSGIAAIPDKLLRQWTTDLTALSIKYEKTLLDIDAEIDRSETELKKLLGELIGDEDDLEGIKTLQRLLGD